MCFTLYRILPNKGAPHSLEEANSIINVQNTRSFLNNCLIFNPKPPLDSSELQLSHHNVRCDLANAPGALSRKNTVYCHVPTPRGSEGSMVACGTVAFLMTYYDRMRAPCAPSGCFLSEPKRN